MSNLWLITHCRRIVRNKGGQSTKAASPDPTCKYSSQGESVPSTKDHRLAGAQRPCDAPESVCPHGDPTRRPRLARDRAVPDAYSQGGHLHSTRPPSHPSSLGNRCDANVGIARISPLGQLDLARNRIASRGEKDPDTGGYVILEVNVCICVCPWIDESYP